MNVTPADRCPAWPEIEAEARRLHRTTIGALARGDSERDRRLVATAPGVRFEFARQRIDDTVMRLLLRLADERSFGEWRNALFEGREVNDTERRPALHARLRAGEKAPAEVRDALEAMFRLVTAIGEARRTGATGRAFRRIVNLGTGGSDLGPRLLVDALGSGERPRGLEIRFASNVDPEDLMRSLEGAEPETTLFVVASKSFDTPETLENARVAREWLAGGLPPGSRTDSHFVAVTSRVEDARRWGAADVLPIWPWVGGRYSLWSAIGFTAALAIGETAFREFLAGGADMDRHFRDEPPGANVPLLIALLGLWNTSFLGAQSLAILPYAHRLRLLPSYLQQLEMESNGKRVGRDGQPVAYATSPVVWGGEETLGQHSYHQLLHHGTPLVPVEFIVVRDGPGESHRRQMLMAHARAQADALAFGSPAPAGEPWREYPGNRPSSTLLVDRVDPRNLGRLIALYEHKVFSQGVLWNVNSFDQWGVELGKRLAAALLAQPRAD